MADLIGYTSAMEADQSRAIDLIHELRDKHLEPEAVRRGGEILKRMGDGWIIAFPSVSAAIETAQFVQLALIEHEEIRLRMAAHLGEIVQDETDIYGAGINITARLQTEAPPGGVMISEDLKRQLDEKLSAGFSDAGTFDLKNVANPVNGFQWRPAEQRKSQRADLPSIAVEPVTSAPETRETLEVCADLQEQLVHGLSRRTGVRVIATDSSFETEATYSLRCRLRRRETEARISCSLTRLGDGQVVWSRFLNGDVENLFELSDRAAEQISNDLRLQINAFDADRLNDVPDDQLSPSELRSRAAMLFYRATVEDYYRAGKLLERALRLDPENGSGLSMWCEAKLYPLEACYREADPELRMRIIERANKAVQTAPRSDYCWYTRAQVRARIAGDLHGARKDIDRIFRLNPTYVLGMEASGYTEVIAGNWEAARKSLLAAVERSTDDPFLPYRLYPLSIAHMMVGDQQRALEAISDATEMRPYCRHFWLVKAWILRKSGKNREAETAAERAEELLEKADILAQNLHLPDHIKKEIGLPTDLIQA